MACAATLALIVALTFALLLPINRRLLSAATSDHIIDGVRLLRRSGAPHAERSLLALIGNVLLLR